MKKVLLLICTILCANVLMAQSFWEGDLGYEVTSTNPAEVEVDDACFLMTANIPETVTYQGTTYSVTSIGNSAFWNSSSLTSVTIPNSVTSIGWYAFKDCSSLTSVDIPNSVTSIGSEAFKNCSSLTSVTIGNSVTSIGEDAFYECYSLTSVTIPNSVTSIGEGAFYDCGLTSVTISNSVTSIGNNTFEDCSGLTSVTIPNSVTSIGGYAFSKCSNLTSVTIPNSVTSIGTGAFYECHSLTSVDIPNSVTSIGDYAFYECYSLTSVDIPNSVTYIEGKAFRNCYSLSSVTIPNSVISIRGEAFRDCHSLSSVTCLRSNSPFLGSDVFDGTPNNKTLTIPCGCESEYTDWQNATTWASIDCLFTIGDLTYEVTSETEVKVQACTESATSVVIPSTITYQGTTYDVTSIGNGAFFECSNLTSVTIPNSVTFIASGAFNACSFLQNVTCLATTPPTLADNDVFPNPNIATLNVPCGSLEAYSAPTSYWNVLFSGRISENGYNVEVSVNDETFGSVAVESDCSTGTLTATANDCYQFVSWNDGNTDNPRIVSLTSDTSLTAIFENLNTELIVNICEGQVYTENNFNVSEAGTYTQTFQTANGCDSIVTLTLNVNPHHNIELTATICPGERFIGNGFNVTAGIYTQTHTSVNGCDSIVTLTVTEYPTFDTTINATINAGETYAEFGFNESEAGTYVQNLQTEFGCDSTITLVLSVNSSLLEAEIEEISFYPNPTNSKITFSQAIEKVEVIDLTGKVIFTFSNAREINIESLPAGVYYLRLTNDEKTIMQKVIKQ